jgi:hypothetical protein
MLCTSNMHLERRLMAGLCCAVSLVASPAKAQPAPPPPPDTLETPYGDTPPPAVPPPAATPPVAPPPATTPPAAQGAPTAAPLPPAASVTPPDKRPLLPIRARRKLALLGELGWNGLAGFGPVLTYHVDPHVSLDLGGGLSLLGWKVGLRGRYNFSTAPFTPFVGVGFNATSGLGQVTSDPSKDQGPKRDPITIDVKASYLVQGVVGFDFIHKRGFTMVGCIGYARLLNQDNFHVLAGSPTAKEQQAFNIFFKSGAVISLASGYAFE